MSRRFVTTIGLVAAIFFSQGSSFLIAALCPHLQPELTHCKTQTTEDSMSHHDMGHVQVQQMKAEFSPQPVAGGVALGRPKGLCLHCSVHSRTTSNAAALGGTEAAKRAYDLTIPVQAERLVSEAAFPSTVVPSRAHGPPGGQTPRHILINIFRI